MGLTVGGGLIGGLVDIAYEMAAPTNLNEAQDLRGIRFCDTSSGCTLVLRTRVYEMTFVAIQVSIRRRYLSALHLGECRPLDNDMMRNLQDQSLVIIGTSVWVIAPGNVVRFLDDCDDEKLVFCLKTRLVGVIDTSGVVTDTLMLRWVTVNYAKWSIDRLASGKRWSKSNVLKLPHVNHRTGTKAKSDCLSFSWTTFAIVAYVSPDTW